MASASILVNASPPNRMTSSPLDMGVHVRTAHPSAAACDIFSYSFPRATGFEWRPPYEVTPI